MPLNGIQDVKRCAAIAMMAITVLASKRTVGIVSPPSLEPATKYFTGRPMPVVGANRR